MNLELISPSLAQNRRVAPRLRVVQNHRFLKQVEAIDLFDGVRGRLDVVEDDERLALGFQVRLGDDLEDGAIFGEDLFEGDLELVDFYPFFEVADLLAVGLVLGFWVGWLLVDWTGHT